MGKTIEQHRARIGSYNNSARIKYMSTLKDISWNTSVTLVLLARRLYSLGCIVYVALLQRMANDVKKIPDPLYMI